MNNHIIQEFSWVTAPLHAYEDSHISKVLMHDYMERFESDLDFHGIMPNYFATTIPEFST